MRKLPRLPKLRIPLLISKVKLEHPDGRPTLVGVYTSAFVMAAIMILCFWGFAAIIVWVAPTIKN